jgi:hypothetical protein
MGRRCEQIRFREKLDFAQGDGLPGETLERNLKRLKDSAQNPLITKWCYFGWLG